MSPRDDPSDLQRVQAPWEANAFWSQTIYADVRRLAGFLLTQRRAGDSISVTLVVHEAFVRLAHAGIHTLPDSEQARRSTFFALMRRAMRSVILDWVRRRTSGTRALERQGGTVEDGDLQDSATGDQFANTLVQAEILAAALYRLAEIDDRAALVAEFRFVRGMSVEQVAKAIDVSERTVELAWAGAKAWLKREITTHPLTTPDHE